MRPVLFRVVFRVVWCGQLCQAPQIDVHPPRQSTPHNCGSPGYMLAMHFRPLHLGQDGQVVKTKSFYVMMSWGPQKIWCYEVLTWFLTVSLFLKILFSNPALRCDVQSLTRPEAEAETWTEGSPMPLAKPSDFHPKKELCPLGKPLGKPQLTSEIRARFVFRYFSLKGKIPSGNLT